MKNGYPLEDVILLGIYPLLFATRRIEIAMLVGLNCLLLIFLLKGINRIIRGPAEKIKWPVLVVAGSAAAHITAGFLSHYFPIQLQELNIYLVLTGTAPIVYAGCRDDYLENFVDLLARFLLLMLITATLRELLGSGSLYNLRIMPSGRAPLGIISTPAGAFLGLGTSWFVLHIAARIKGLVLDEKLEEKRGEAVE